MSRGVGYYTLSLYLCSQWSAYLATIPEEKVLGLNRIYVGIPGSSEISYWNKDP